MVQRKIHNKLGIQADHQTRLVISLKKPSLSQHQDGKSRVPEVKKKRMKKSRSQKLSDIGQQSLRASSPPSSSPNVPSSCPKALATPKKPASGLARSAESSPNYMKSTSCFDARKQLQSPARFSTGAKLVVASSGAKKPIKSSVSKLGVRTLTKTPSFKPLRVSLCGSSDRAKVRRATCSSTLKDSKFPSYLALDHGASESEGTSVIKVCPYTYCSLNGRLHKHASLPPLKRFLSAKRRALKTQKSTNLAAPSDKGIRAVDEEELAERVGINFFIEIYAETEKKSGFVSPKVAESYTEDEQVVESLSEGSAQSEVGAEESPERCREIELAEAAERDYVFPFSDEEGTEGNFGSDMEWEEGEFVESEKEDGAENSSKIDDETDSSSGFLSEIENLTEDLQESNDFSNCDVDMNQECEEETECFGGPVEDSEEVPCNEDQCKDFNGSEEINEPVEDKSDVKISEEIETSDSSESIEEYEKEVTGVESVDTSAEDKKIEISILKGTDDDSPVKLEASETEQDNKGEIEIMEVEPKINRESKRKSSSSHTEQENLDEELRNKWSRGKRAIKDSEEESARKFNPREPNYLPLPAEPGGEKVDLKHQEIDERKNSEDWMIDRALQQAVTKLGPARKRRVALLVEAFETVSPITKFESHQPNRPHHHHHHPSSPVFQHAIMPIQACN